MSAPASAAAAVDDAVIASATAGASPGPGTATQSNANRIVNFKRAEEIEYAAQTALSTDASHGRLLLAPKLTARRFNPPTDWVLPATHDMLREFLEMSICNLPMCVDMCGCLLHGVSGVPGIDAEPLDTTVLVERVNAAYAQEDVDTRGLSLSAEENNSPAVYLGVVRTVHVVMDWLLSSGGAGDGDAAHDAPATGDLPDDKKDAVWLLACMAMFPAARVPRRLFTGEPVSPDAEWDIGVFASAEQLDAAEKMLCGVGLLQRVQAGLGSYVSPMHELVARCVREYWVPQHGGSNAADAFAVLREALSTRAVAAASSMAPPDPRSDAFLQCAEQWCCLVTQEGVGTPSVSARATAARWPLRSTEDMRRAPTPSHPSPRVAFA